ncbi:MAG TPA: TrmB family transcriptional regulator [Bacteroidetes bacterium]|nr:TrmB family transcriptional regulator [Bacteroidota bacterium]
MLGYLIELMKQLGFTNYEAKTYLYLLKNNPATRYELSKYSAVPRSAIYSVINKLENDGLVNAIDTEPKRYIPLPPEQLIKLLETRHQGILQEFRENLNKLERPSRMDHLWNIRGYKNLILKAKELIRDAGESIYLSIWKREAVLLKNELEHAEKRAVKIVIFTFTALPFEVGRILSHNLDEKDLEKVWDHKIILCVDRKELLMGEADTENQKNVAWTHNKALIAIALNHIVLDISLFGQRYGVNIDDCVVEMREGELEYLGKLLAEKYQNNTARTS